MVDERALCVAIYRARAVVTKDNFVVIGSV